MDLYIYKISTYACIPWTTSTLVEMTRGPGFPGGKMEVYMYDYLCHHPNTVMRYWVRAPQEDWGGGAAAIQYFEQVFRRTNGKDASQAISSIPNTSINKFSSEGD